MNLDDFGVKVCDGSSLKTLRMGQGFFSELGVSIVRYTFTTDSTKSRRYSSLGKKALKSCEICDRELFHSNFNGDEHYVRQKKRLTFIDTCGDKHHTCYKLNACLTRSGFTGKTSSKPDFKIPTFLEFLDLPQDEIDKSDKTKHLLEDAEKSFNSKVVPFLSKWLYKPVNKNCVIEFITEFNALSPHFIYYELDEVEAAKEKILNIIGVSV